MATREQLHREVDALSEDLVAPALMWSEARSTLHLGLLNGKVSAEHAATQHERLETCPVRRVDEPELEHRPRGFVVSPAEL